MSNVTSIISRHHANALDICRADGVVALHCATAKGIVIVTLSEREFVLKARGPADSNDCPWRTLSTMATVRQAERDAAATAAKCAPPAPVTTPLPVVAPVLRSCGSRAARNAAATSCTDAWEWHKQNLHLTHCAVADAFGVRPGSYSTWLNRNHHGELRRLRIASGISLAPQPDAVNVRPPVLKPGGHIL